MFLSIENGFINRFAEVDINVIKRVMTAYNKSKEVQQNAPEEYQVSHMWLPIYQGYMGGLMDVMARRDVAELSRLYGNFFREQFTVGVHGMPVDMQTCYFSGNISEENASNYLANIMHRMQIWLDSIGKTHALSALKTPLVGNPYGFYIDGEFYRAGVDYQHYYATVIDRLTRSERRRAVLELGGGFGGLGDFLLRAHADLTYIDVDLPENMALTAFYLLSAHPDKKIALYGEIDLSTADLRAYDAVVLPNFALPELKDNSIDLSFNSYSLAEMSLNNVANYIAHFNRLTTKFIYHINHTRIPPVLADQFPIDYTKFELISRAPANWNLATNKNMDEYEFLYKASNLRFSD